MIKGAIRKNCMILSGVLLVAVAVRKKCDLPCLAPIFN